MTNETKEIRIKWSSPWIPVICGIVMAISAILPWASVNILFGRITISAVNSGSGGWLFIAAGVLYAVFSFIGGSRVKGILHILIGVVSIFLTVGYWFANIQHNYDWVSPQFGLFIFAIATIVGIGIGIKETSPSLFEKIKNW